ncbi:MAG TPA: thioesterase family protein [Solirubrobacterales bacterium]|jgi:predicted thioesterase|nr:thioesterase family protein [Solirubrobacterales bacterium]
MALEPGLHGEFHFKVDERLSTDVAGTVTNPVLATPRMIGLMERASMMAVSDHLPEGATSVGFEVCVRHVAAAPTGAQCVARSELTEVVDDRKLRFAVEVLHGERTIGIGTHERRVIHAAGFSDRNVSVASTPES